jgi:hypothetical protein
MSQIKIEASKISLNPIIIIAILGALGLFLIVASIAGQLLIHFTRHNNIFIPLFDLNKEINFPAYYSSFLLLFASFLILIITILEKKRNAAHISKWAILSFIFLVLSCDEMLSFHEKVGPIILKKLGGDHLLGIFHYTWVIAGIIFVLMFAIFYLRFFLRLNKKTKLNFLIAAILYVGGALGFEMIGGNYRELFGYETSTFTMPLILTAEESLEISGAIFFIWALLVYISDNYKKVQFEFTTGKKQ